MSLPDVVVVVVDADVDSDDIGGRMEDIENGRSKNALMLGSERERERQQVTIEVLQLLLLVKRSLVNRLWRHPSWGKAPEVFQSQMVQLCVLD